MSDLTSEEKIEAIQYWQDHPFFHPLICGEDSTHLILEPHVNPEGGVWLRCPTCDYTQDCISESVYETYRIKDTLDFMKFGADR